ncbi:protein tweety homolog 1 isoform X2 [Hypanus sabinus]|uniref:protein tweety homolog 1 isoform X2 n=1 Tax=Hypanus sabinus TaxID=79690 RepID=UPI0028C399FE|nr:protein tweety homolog 1 isoform X2 [Hypanus sabinus]
MALLLSWLGLGVDFAAALALSDLCVQPEVYILNTSQWEQVLSSDIVEYYVSCDGKTPNPFQQSLTLSQRAMSDIHQKLLSLLRGSATELPSAQHLQDLWTGLCWDGLEGALGLSVLSLLSVATFSSLAACLPQVWALSVGTRDSATEEEPEEPEELEGEDIFRPPEWKQLPRYLSRPRLHTFSSYGRPSLRAPTPTRPWTPTLHYM